MPSRGACCSLPPETETLFRAGFLLVSSPSSENVNYDWAGSSYDLEIFMVRSDLQQDSGSIDLTTLNLLLLAVASPEKGEVCGGQKTVPLLLDI